MNARDLKIFGGGFILVFILTMAVHAAWPGIGNGVRQPIRFSHKKHTAQGIGCEVCHTFAQEQSFAAIPTRETCLMCHGSPITKSPEEEKIREYAKRGEDIPWKRIYWIPSHVYFSHRRHVTMGQIECKACHGAMGEAASPPRYPLKDLKMNDCLGCHRQRKVAAECLACHK